MALVVVTVVLGATLAHATDQYVWAFQLGAFPASWIGAPPTRWGSLVTVTPWLARLMLWYAVCWAATRNRAAGRTVALPGALAVGGVSVLSVATFGWPQELAFTWLGPMPPFVLVLDAPQLSLTVANPAVGFPALAAAGLAVASWCGARAGRARGVGALRRTSPMSTAATVLIPGLPVLACATGAAVAYWATTHDVGSTADRARWLCVELLLPLVAPLVGAVLLSGTGRAGAIVAGLLAVTAGATWVADWWAGGPDSRLVVGVCATLACALAATWRPAALWLDDLLDPPRRG